MKHLIIKGQTTFSIIPADSLNTHLTLSCVTVPFEVSPAPTLALLPAHGEVGVADEVHVHGHAGRFGGAVLEWLEV